MSREFKIGPYSAYAIAVKYGYQGTEEEWIRETEQKRTDAAASAQQAAEYAGAAQNSAAAAANADSNAHDALKETIAAKEAALNAVGTAYSTAVQGIQSKQDTAVDAISSAQNTAEEAVAEKQSSAVSAVQSAQTTAETSVTKAQTAALTAVSDKQTAALDSIKSASSTALTDIESKKTDSIAAVETSGQKILDSIPEDYTVALKRVDALEAQMDDATVSSSNTWSAKHIVDMLCPPVEETGNPVQLSGILPGYPLGATASWEPTQDGEGDPSPDNIRPIHGRDSVSVTRCGENLAMDVPLNPKPDSGGSIIYHQPLQKSTVSLSFHLKGAFNANRVNAAFIEFRNSHTMEHRYLNFSSICDANSVDSTSGTIDADIKLTISDTFDTVYLIFTTASYVTFDPDSELTNFMLVRGSVPTAYSPYTGQTNTLSLPATIYGGSVDAETGEGRETWHLMTLTGKEKGIGTLPVKDGLLEYYVYLDDDKPARDNKEAIQCVCNQYPARTREETGRGIYGVAVNLRNIRIYDQTCKDLEGFKAHLSAQYNAGTPVQVAYKLAEPLPFNAAGAKALPTLSGINTVMTDADTLTVTARADPIKRITDLEDAVASMTTNE